MGEGGDELRFGFFLKRIFGYLYRYMGGFSVRLPTVIMQPGEPGSDYTARVLLTLLWFV